jgi:hypothetical protein
MTKADNTGIYKFRQKTLKTLCFNIDDINEREKLNLLTAAIKADSPPDVVCLTEVSESTFKYLSTGTDALKDYVFFQVFISEENETGSVILCNKDTVSISEQESPYYFDYPKGTGRIMGTGIVHHTSGLTFNILTADIDHKQEDIRDIQISTLTKVISNIDKDSSYILMGDLGASCEGLSTLKDTWTSVGCPARLASTIIDLNERRTRILYGSGGPQRTGSLNIKALSYVGTKHQICSNYGVEAIFNLSKRGG